MGCGTLENNLSMNLSPSEAPRTRVVGAGLGWSVSLRCASASSNGKVPNIFASEITGRYVIFDLPVLHVGLR